MLVFALLFLVPFVSGYECSDGCVISDSYTADGYCDCSDCGEEPDWNCNSCLCPTACGSYFMCQSDTNSSGNGTIAFQCDDGCEISPSYQNDGWCDCSDCEDEADYTCASCGGCPTTCGNYVTCDGGGGGNGTGGNSTTAPGFMCDDGCEINNNYVSDDWCDCTNCEDESAWTCESCNGCPTTCAGYTKCGGGGGNSTGNSTASSGFTCDDGCVIGEAYVSDDYCDCTNCEDESAWTCESCGGCPTECGGYFECGVGGDTTEAPQSTAPQSTAGDFTCDDGCVVAAAWVGDDYCDCANCEEETAWDCESCGGCPTECGGYHECEGVPLTTAVVPQTTGGVPQTTAVFTCNDGCDIDESYVEDEWCDCSECEDESAWNCDACGGCPAECGQYVECALPSTEAPTTEAPATTHSTGPTRINEAAAVRLLLAAALSLLSAMAL